MLFLGPSTSLGIWSITNLQEFLLFISVNFRLNNYANGSGFLFCHVLCFVCGFLLWVKENQQN